MTRNLILGLFCLILVGCAASPPAPSGAETTPEQEQQAAQEAAREAEKASAALKQGHKDAALAAYRTAFDLDPKDAVSANNLALLLREKGQFREAVTLLQKGIEHSPETAELHYNLAVIAELYLLDLELALAHYRRYRALTAETDQEAEGQLVAGWIADLERRLD